MVGYDMFGEMTRGITEDTFGMLFTSGSSGKVEREQVAKVTGTNKDDSAVKEPRSGRRRRFTPMTPVPAAAERNTNSAVGAKSKAHA